MLFFLILIWGFDLFILPGRMDFSFNVLMKTSHKTFFLMCFGLFILATLEYISLETFPLLFFAVLSFYVYCRCRAEKDVYKNVYYEQRSPVKSFLFFFFLGILIKWFWGVLFLSAIFHMLAIYVPLMNSDLGQASFLSLAAGLWMIVLIKDFCRQTGTYAVREMFGLSAGKASFFINKILPILLGVVISAASAYVLVYRQDQPVTPFSELLDWADMSWAWGIFLFSAIMIAPFLEEIIFRGFFFKMIQDFKNRQWAFWIVALSFGLLHMEQYWGDWIGIGIVFLIGIILTLLRRITQSTKPGILLHYTFNILMLILPGILFITSHPSFAEYHMNQEKTSIEQKKELLRRSIEEDKRNAMAYHELSWMYLEHGGDLLEALGLMDKALEISPQRTIFQHTKAEILYALGRQQEALIMLEEISQKMPDNQEILKRIREMREKI